MTGNFVVLRGFFKGVALIGIGALVTLLIATFLQYTALRRNDEAASHEPWSWQAVEPQRSFDRPQVAPK